MQLKTKPTAAAEQSGFAAKLALFLKQAAITKNLPALQAKISAHLHPGKPAHYLLFRHSSLYFFAGETVVTIEDTHDKYTDAAYLRFDGLKITRIDPEYYLGPARLQPLASTAGFDIWFGGDFRSDSSNNNNNNNNNNNGNNGNNG